MMRGTPSWTHVYHRDYGYVYDVTGAEVYKCRRVNVEIGLVERIKTDAEGNVILNSAGEVVTFYEVLPAPLKFVTI